MGRVLQVAGEYARLYRSRSDRKLAGVCGGLGQYFGVDPTVIRLLWVLSGVFVFTIPFSIIGYFVAAVIMPEEPV